jgi:acetyltransferase-like isoleucine patch superfamily enzyme
MNFLAVMTPKFPSEDRVTYESKYGTYKQPRHFLRKILGRIIPAFPGWKIRKKLYALLGVNIHKDVKFIGLDTTIDDVFPELITIDEDVVISLKVIIIAHDDASHAVAPIHIKKGAFIGTGAIILPGITIGENAIIAAGAVVTKNIADNSTAMGVPAKQK